MADMSAFTGLPIEELIGGPLLGAAKGQAKLAESQWISSIKWHFRKME